MREAMADLRAWLATPRRRARARAERRSQQDAELAWTHVAQAMGVPRLEWTSPQARRHLADAAERLAN